MSSLEIRHISCLATPVGRSALRGSEQGRIRVLREAALRAEDGRISFVGTETDYRATHPPPASLTIEARGRTALPGFVDAHTHPVWAGDRAAEFARRLEGETYSAIAAQGGGILETVRATRAASTEELTAQTASRLRKMLESGTTTAEAKSGYGLTVKEELRSLEILDTLSRQLPLRIVPTLLAAHETPLEFRADRTAWVRAMVEEILPEVARRRLAPFCDVFCEDGVFSVEESRAILSHARQLGLGLRVHAEELGHSGGARLAAELGACSADHLLYATDEDIHGLERAGVIGVLLPGTAWWLGNRRPPARPMIEAGVAVAIATDANPGSCNTESVPAVAAHACLDCGLTIEEALTAITLNAAASLNLAREIGSLEEGKRADLVLLEAPDYRHLIYHWGVNLVSQVIVDGRPVWGEVR